MTQGARQVQRLAAVASGLEQGAQVQPGAAEIGQVGGDAALAAQLAAHDQGLFGPAQQGHRVLLVLRDQAQRVHAGGHDAQMAAFTRLFEALARQPVAGIPVAQVAMGQRQRANSGQPMPMRACTRGEASGVQGGRLHAGKVGREHQELAAAL